MDEFIKVLKEGFADIKAEIGKSKVAQEVSQDARTVENTVGEAIKNPVQTLANLATLEIPELGTVEQIASHVTDLTNGFNVLLTEFKDVAKAMGKI